MVEVLEFLTVRATCGHAVTFRVNTEKPMANRIGKHTGRKCGPCRILDDQARQAAGLDGKATIKKGQESKHLPAGTSISLLMGDDGTWLGSLYAQDVVIQAQGSGLMGVISNLAKAWLVQHGYRVKK